jgi:hypothetical protein
LKLQGLDQADAYIAAVAQMKKREQDALYMELVNGGRQRSAGYNLRIGNDVANGCCFYLCRNDFLNDMCIGKKRYATLKAANFIPGVNLHKTLETKILLYQLRSLLVLLHSS